MGANEDTNKDGILQIAGTVNRDTNGDGQLTPGIPVLVSPSSLTTDDSGIAKFTLSYGKNFAAWVDLVIEARAQVGGTESKAFSTYTLEALAKDLILSSPPNFASPFGAGPAPFVNSATSFSSGPSCFSPN
jgi:hypothetical protein